MKPGLFLIAGLAGGVLGFGIEKLLESQRETGLGSMAGQTLVDLSRALEIEKTQSGAYPESIGGLTVLSDSAEFSQSVLRRVIYRKTTDGYVAFVGAPQAVYVEPGKSAQFTRSIESDNEPHSTHP